LESGCPRIFFFLAGGNQKSYNIKGLNEQLTHDEYECKHGRSLRRCASGSQETLQSLEPQIQNLLEITGIPGCSIGVLHQGVEWKFSHGFANVEEKITVKSDTAFNLNSLTKSITAAAFACLVHDGKISWHTPIKAVLPDFAEACDTFDQSMNAVDLLSMRSGHHAFNCLTWQGNNIILPHKSDTIKYWNATPRL
jgi:CubicO group peptidase (beta-lactamase class C family)